MSGSGTTRGSTRGSLLRRWDVGDRCRIERFGEWRNGTIKAFAYDGDVALVLRDGEAVERHVLSINLRKAVDE